MKLTERFTRILRKVIELNRPVYFLDFATERAPDGALYALYRKGLLQFDFSNPQRHHSWFVPTEAGRNLIKELDNGKH